MAADAGPDLVVLDLGLPDVPGEEVARELRAASDVPIVMLTARADERDRIAGLELGADDYVSKPFSPRELVLRVQAVLRRGGGPRRASRTGPMSFGDGELHIDEDRREVVVRGAPVELTPTEWGLLERAGADRRSRVRHATNSSTRCAATSSKATSEPSTRTSRTCAARSRTIHSTR